MCTAMYYRGDDTVYGFNLDIDPQVWNFRVIATKACFSVGITVGSTTYLTHGVTADGRFANLPYMNGAPFTPPRGARRRRIDLLVDRYLRGKYTFGDLDDFTEKGAVVSPPAASMHALFADGEGRAMIVEPGYGRRKVTENHAVLTNFPVLANLTDFSNPFYGKDRYDVAADALRSCADFSAADALRLLEQVKVTGRWGTRVSFVYSQKERAVWYALDGDFSKIQKHGF